MAHIIKNPWVIGASALAVIIIILIVGSFPGTSAPNYSDRAIADKTATIGGSDNMSEIALPPVDLGTVVRPTQNSAFNHNLVYLSTRDKPNRYQAQILIVDTGVSLPVKLGSLVDGAVLIEIAPNYIRLNRNGMTEYAGTMGRTPFE